MKEAITKIFSLILTISAFVIFIKGDYTNGLLMAILGELVDIDYRIKEILTPSVT